MRGGRAHRNGGGKFCAELRGAFCPERLREGAEAPTLPAVAAQPPPLRFPLKEIARVHIEHPVSVRLEGTVNAR